MTITSKIKDAVKKAAPKRPQYAEPAPEKLEPEAVYTPPPPPADAVPPPKKNRPLLPERFLNGGGTAEERDAWIKENWE